jgi:hypothetical protein
MDQGVASARAMGKAIWDNHGTYMRAWNMHHTVDWTPYLLRAVLRNGPPASGPIGARAVSGLRNVTGRRLRTHRDLGRERAADSTYRRTYLRPCRPPGPNGARTCGGPTEQTGPGPVAGRQDLGAIGDMVTASDH